MGCSKAPHPNRSVRSTPHFVGNGALFIRVGQIRGHPCYPAGEDPCTPLRGLWGLFVRTKLPESVIT